MENLETLLKIINREFDEVEYMCKGSTELYRRLYGMSFVTKIKGYYRNSSPATKLCCQELFNRRMKDLFKLTKS